MKFPKFGSRKMDFSPETPIPAIDVIATKTPAGMIVHTECAVTHDTSVEFADVISKRTFGILEGMKYMRGDKVGLEWRTPTGRKLEKSDEWAQTSFVPVTIKKGDEPFNNYGQPLSESAVHLESFKRDWNKEIKFSDEDYEKWLEDFNHMCEYVDRVKLQFFTPS